MSKIKTDWQLWTYDVWGNATDGYQVNDRSCIARHCEIVCKVEVNNPGSPMMFKSAYPGMRQIRAAFGLTGSRDKLSLDGDDLNITIEREKDGYPIGEMFCNSHDSLSPIRKKDQPS